MPEHELANHQADNPISDSVKWTINQLSQQEIDILNYRLLQKKEILEIAELTGKNYDAVKYILKKARKNFIAVYSKKFKLGPEKKEGDTNEKV
jgi:signal transduction histidine kinase